MAVKLMTIPENVKQDTLDYRCGLGRFVAGETDAAKFKAYRVPMGIYEQRVDGTYMVRVRIPAGIFTSEQAVRVAELSGKFGNGIVHVTTRQDLQLHNVRIEDTPDVLEKLMEVGLSTRGGGGNTVRNVSACAKAGICSNELFDVSPYAIALTEFLVGQKESFNLPRKYKIAFSGCGNDCGLASIADLGFFATIKDGVAGFAVYAGGGLGGGSAVAVKIEEFVGVNEIFEIAVAIRNVFDKFGDRTNRSKARLRFVVRRLGQDGFINAYKQERGAVGKASVTVPQPAINDNHEQRSEILWSNIHAQKQPGLYYARLALKLGDIPARDLIETAKLANEFGDGTIRTTQSQDLLVVNAGRDNIEKLSTGLRSLSVDVNYGGPKIITCTGSATCKLGLCLSKNMAKAIDEELNQKDAIRNDLSIRISGCPNACGGHFIADIGFQGRASRVNDRLMPSYNVLTGGGVGQDKARLGEVIGVLPAKRVPGFVADVLSCAKFDNATLHELIAVHSDPTQITENYFYDFGAEEPFALTKRI